MRWSDSEWKEFFEETWDSRHGWTKEEWRQWREQQEDKEKTKAWAVLAANSGRSTVELPEARTKKRNANPYLDGWVGCGGWGVRGAGGGGKGPGAGGGSVKAP